jgi:hypothetical protein
MAGRILQEAMQSNQPLKKEVSSTSTMNNLHQQQVQNHLTQHRRNKTN